MATQTVQIAAPAGLSSVTIKLFTENTDAETDSQTATPGTNDPSLYSADFDVAAGRYRATLFSGSTPVAVDHVTLTATTATFPVEGLGSPISVADILTTALTESYAADGASPTLTQAIMLIQQHLSESSISGTNKTVKQLDGSTTAAQFTLNDASAPTSITRTS